MNQLLDEMEKTLDRIERLLDETESNCSRICASQSAMIDLNTHMSKVLLNVPFTSSTSSDEVSAQNMAYKEVKQHD
jgi:hypothetical protein